MRDITGDVSRPRALSGMLLLAPRTEERAVASPDGRLPAAGCADLTAEHTRPKGRDARWRELRCPDQATLPPNKLQQKLGDCASAGVKLTASPRRYLPKPTPSRTRRKPTLRGCRSTRPPRLACTEQLMLKTWPTTDGDPAPEAERAHH